MKMMPQQYCLRWKHHHSNVQSMFAQLLEKERFCDVTLYCSPSFASQADRAVDSGGMRGVSLRAHRVVLAACSELLGALLGAHESLGEPVLVIDGAEPRHLRALLDYMYTGEMNVHHSQLASLLKTAEELRIKGLTDIRWNNKDEPPDCHTGAVTTSLKKPPPSERKSPAAESPGAGAGAGGGEAVRDTGREGSSDADVKPPGSGADKHSVNGGPPPLIKLPTRTDKSNPLKREHSDGESVSSKRQRALSGTEHTDDEDRDTEWHHGNMDVKVERMMAWGMEGRPGEAGEGGEAGGSGAASWERDASDDEWADAPADIGSFLHTRLRVDGDNSGDEESNEEAPSTSSSAGASAVDLKVEPSSKGGGGGAGGTSGMGSKLTIGPKSGPTDPRFTDVVKLNDYLKHGRRPQFWEENYVKRVMEAVRIKELEMKQAAEILGVSYGTLYGRYRDVFGCINRPYRTSRDFWQAKGPSDVLDRLQRGEMSIEAGALTLGVSPSNLAAYIADLSMTILPADKEFEPIPIEIDPIPVELEPSPKKSSSTAGGPGLKGPRRTFGGADKCKKSVTVSSVSDEEIPATVISAHDGRKPAPAPGKWPSIRIASIDSLRGGGGGGGASPTSTSTTTAAPPTPTSPSALMRTRPDLTIVAARKPDPRREDDEGT